MRAAHRKNERASALVLRQRLGDFELEVMIQHQQVLDGDYAGHRPAEPFNQLQVVIHAQVIDQRDGSVLDQHREARYVQRPDL